MTQGTVIEPMTTAALETQAAVLAAAPVERAARLASLDVLRGFALLGILLANVQNFAAPRGPVHDIPLDVVSQPQPHQALDLLVMTLEWVFVEGKMRSLFAALFGAGTVLLLERIERRGGGELAADIFHRRNLWLLLFGVLHGTLIWYGDILLFYSSLALLALYPLRHVTATRLIVVGLALALTAGTFGRGNALGVWSALPAATLQEGAVEALRSHREPTPQQQQAIAAAAVARDKALQAYAAEIAVARSGYLKSEPQNARDEAKSISNFYYTGRMLDVLGILIAGMGLYKTGFLSARLPARTYIITALAGYAITISVVLVGLYHARRSGFSDAVTLVWMYAPYGLQEIAGTLANASLLLLLVRRGVWMLLQGALAAVGRMALSNYILTSLVCQFVFSWGPWKLFGTLEYYEQIYVVLCVWLANILGSVLWLKFCAFGPLEWLWRSLTYWQRQPLICKAGAAL